MPRSIEPPQAAKLIATSELEVDDTGISLALAGTSNERLRAIERAAGVATGLRGNRLLLEGSAASVSVAERFLADAIALLREGIEARTNDVARAIQALRTEPRHEMRDRERGA